MHEIDPTHVKETSFTCSLVTKKLFVVLECVKDCASGALDSTDCLCLFVIMPLARSVVECDRFVGPHKLFKTCLKHVFSIIDSWCEAIFSQDVAKEGR